MDLSKVIITILGSANAGVLSGFLIFNLFRTKIARNKASEKIVITNKRQETVKPEEQVTIEFEKPATPPEDKRIVETSREMLAEVIPQKLEVIRQSEQVTKATMHIPEELILDKLEEVPRNERVVEVKTQVPGEIVSQAQEAGNQKDSTFETRKHNLENSKLDKEAEVIPPYKPVVESAKSSKEEIYRKLEKIIQKNIPTTVPSQQSPKSDLIKELETNLEIASTVVNTFTIGSNINKLYLPSVERLLLFQTIAWDSKHGEGEASLNAHHQEIMGVYFDVRLANNIAWQSSEAGCRSKELDESYLKLCTDIAESSKRLLPLANVGQESSM
jgi:hypothetical protein